MIDSFKLKVETLLEEPVIDGLLLKAANLIEEIFVGPCYDEELVKMGEELKKKAAGDE